MQQIYTGERYADGRHVEQQREAGARYRANQRRLREWVDGLAATNGMSRNDLISLNPYTIRINVI